MANVAPRAEPLHIIFGTIYTGATPGNNRGVLGVVPGENNVQLFARRYRRDARAPPEIDERITRYCENYEFRRISAVDRNVGGLEFRNVLPDDIPRGLDQRAIELAKESEDQTRRFVTASRSGEKDLSRRCARRRRPACPRMIE